MIRRLLLTVMVMTFTLSAGVALAGEVQQLPTGCDKIEFEDDVVSWTADRDYEIVSLKAGGTITVWNEVRAGTRFTAPSGKDISHVVFCVEVNTEPPSSTTTTLQESLTTTVPPTTTTTTVSPSTTVTPPPGSSTTVTDDCADPADCLPFTGPGDWIPLASAAGVGMLLLGGAALLGSKRWLV